MTIVEGRRPRQKLHKTLAHAKNAFDTPKFNGEVPYPYKYGKATTHGWGALYEFSVAEGAWVLLYEIRQPTQDDVLIIEHKSWTEHRYETRPWRLKD